LPAAARQRGRRLTCLSSRLLDQVIARKMAYRAIGGAGGWWQVVLSGMLANWLVGMAAFFAVMGRSIIGKYIPVFLAVTLFVAANFQHSPANMGYFSLIMPTGRGPGWGAALAWNIIPAGIGNMAGGAPSPHPGRTGQLPAAPRTVPCGEPAPPGQGRGTVIPRRCTGRCGPRSLERHAVAAAGRPHIGLSAVPHKITAEHHRV
jgi:hypothetical protein